MKLTTIISVGLLSVFASASDIERENILNAVNNNENSTWSAKIHSRFKGTSFDVLKRMCGSLSQGESGIRNVYHHAMTEEEISAIPDAFSSIEAWPHCDSIKEVRDQSDCGSCWAFGAVEAASDRICIASKGVLQARLSSENLVACCKDCGYGCNGGYPLDAWKYFITDGVPTGGLYGDTKTCQPYSLPPCDHHTEGRYGPCPSEDYATPKCRKTCDKDSEVTDTFSDEVEALRFSTSYYVGSTESQIQREIMTYGPVEASFTVYSDFELYSSGVYQHTHGEFMGGHAVKIIGWGVDEGTPYWTIANSWNEDWGEGGFFRILRGSNHCSIESGVVAGRFDLKSMGNLRTPKTLDNYFD